MPNTCHTTEGLFQVCTDCTGSPFVPGDPGIPAHIVEQPVLAWNAGANSRSPSGGQKLLNGNLHTTFEVGPSGGIVVGLALPPRPDVMNPASIAYGWYVTTVARALFAQPVEYGVPKGDAFQVTAATQLTVRRVDGVVTYLTGGPTGTLQYTSEVRSAGAVLVGSALFASGDRIE